MNKLSKIKKHPLILWVFGILLLIVTIWYGYDKTVGVIINCKAITQKYVTAEYSEDTVEICYDADYIPYTCTDTEYWSEPASDTWVAIAINGELTMASADTHIDNGAHYTDTPPHNINLRRTRNFDRFKKHTDTKLTITTKDEFTKEITTFSEPITKTANCNMKVNKPVIVKTWYGITYGSEF